jgi:hypothetical protein
VHARPIWYFIIGFVACTTLCSPQDWPSVQHETRMFADCPRNGWREFRDVVRLSSERGLMGKCNVVDETIARRPGSAHVRTLATYYAQLRQVTLRLERHGGKRIPARHAGTTAGCPVSACISPPGLSAFPCLPQTSGLSGAVQISHSSIRLASPPDIYGSIGESFLDERLSWEAQRFSCAATALRNKKLSLLPSWAQSHGN